MKTDPLLKRLRDAQRRQGHGFTRKLARSAGINENQITGWLRGHRKFNPTTATVRKLCAALNRVERAPEDQAP